MRLHKRILQLHPKTHSLPNGALAVLIGSKMVAYARTPNKRDIFRIEWHWVHINFQFTPKNHKKGS